MNLYGSVSNSTEYSNYVKQMRNCNFEKIKNANNKPTVSVASLNKKKLQITNLKKSVMYEVQ